MGEFIKYAVVFGVGICVGGVYMAAKDGSDQPLQAFTAAVTKDIEVGYNVVVEKIKTATTPPVEPEEGGAASC